MTKKETATQTTTKKTRLKKVTTKPGRKSKVVILKDAAKALKKEINASVKKYLALVS